MPQDLTEVFRCEKYRYGRELPYNCTCGGEAEVIHESWGRGAEGWSVRCKKCGKMLTYGKTEEHVIKTWNRKNPSSQKDGEKE